MAHDVNAMIKISDADKESTDQFISERFKDVFSSSKMKTLAANKVSYKGGSLFRPYGFKAESTMQPTSDGALIVKLWGRPTIYPMAYLLMIMIIGFIIGVIIDPLEHGFAGLLVLLFLFLLNKERKGTNKRINQVLEEVKIRFS